MFTTIDIVAQIHRYLVGKENCVYRVETYQVWSRSAGELQGVGAIATADRNSFVCKYMLARSRHPVNHRPEFSLPPSHTKLWLRATLV
ncbi:MAG: hypothetical protein ABI885_28410 [Gammaproteobacteria bacterium]